MNLLYLAASSLFFLLTLSQLAGALRPNRGKPQSGNGVWRGRALLFLVGVGIMVVLDPLLERYWMVGGPELFDLRARYFSSGLSPLPPWLLVGLAIFTWTLLELFRGRRLALESITWPVPSERSDTYLKRSGEIAKSLDQLMTSTLPSIPFLPPAREMTATKPAALFSKSRFWIGLAVALAPPLILLWIRMQPLAERRHSGQAFLVLLTFCVVIGASSFRQFFASWLTLERLLDRLALSRLFAAFVRAFAKVEGQAQPWSPMRSFGWRLPHLQMVKLSVEKLEQLWTSGSSIGKSLHEPIKAAVERLSDAKSNQDLEAESVARTDLNCLFNEISRQFDAAVPDERTEEFLAIRIASYIRAVFIHMRYCLAEAVATFLLALFAVGAYAFEPKWFALLGLWSAILTGIGLTFWLFIQMDRDRVISAIGGTNAGEITVDRHFYWNVFQWGVIPLAAALAIYFPEIGRMVANFMSQIVTSPMK